MPTQNIYEFIVLQQKDAHTDLLPFLADYDREARSVEGSIASRHFQSFYALPQLDSVPVYVLVYQWRERDTISLAVNHLTNTSAIGALLAVADIVALALTEQVEGDAIDVSRLASESGQVLEVAVRRVKADQVAEFDAQRRAFVNYLSTKSAVIASYELKAVLGNQHENLTVGLTIYRDIASFQELATEIMASPSTMSYFATFDAEALKYTQTL